MLLPIFKDWEIQSIPPKIFHPHSGCKCDHDLCEIEYMLTYPYIGIKHMSIKMEKYCNNKCVYESLQDNFHQRLKNQRMLTFLSSLRSRSAKIRVLDDRIISRSDHDLDHFWRKNDSSWLKFESGKILDFILINSKPQILLFLLIFFAKRHAKRGGLL